MDLRRLGIRVKAAREAAGLSQDELGRRIGAGKSAIQKLEAGRHEPKIDRIARISTATGTTPNGLLGFNEDAAARLELPPPPAQAVAIGLDVLGLGTPDRRAILRIVASLRSAGKASSRGNPRLPSSTGKSRSKKAAP